MSFVELRESFDNVKDYITQATKKLSVLSTVFEELRDAEENYANSLTLVSRRINEDLVGANEITPLIQSFASLEEYLLSEAKLHNGLAKSYTNDLAESLDMFLTNYTSTFQDAQLAAQNIIKKFIKGRSRLETKREKYFKRAAVAERAEQIVNLEDEENRAYQATNNYNKAKALTERALDMYVLSFENELQNWNEFNTELPKLLNTLQNSEESRIQFCKYTLEKLLKLLAKTTESSSNLREELSKSVAGINVKNEITMIVKSNKQDEIFERERFITYVEWKHVMRLKGQNPIPLDNSYIVNGKDYVPMDPDVTVCKTVIYSLCPLASGYMISEDSESETPSEKSGYDLDPVAYDANAISRVTELLQTKHGRVKFVDILESRRRASILSSFNLKQVAGLVNTLLTAMVMEEDKDPVIFYKIIVLSHSFYCQSPKRRIFLYDFISRNSIWQDKQRWLHAIDCGIYSRKMAERESFYRLKSSTRKRNWTFFTPRSNLPPKFSEERAHRTSTISILHCFNYYMTNLGLPLRKADEVALFYCQSSQIGVDKSVATLVDLWSNQIYNSKQPIKSSILKCTRERAKERIKWGNLMHIGLCMDYLTILDQCCCLLVCKKWKTHLQTHVMKHALLSGANSKMIDNINLNIWNSLLLPRTLQSTYSELLYKLKQNPEKITQYEEVIRMDVLRSYFNDPLVPQDSLRNVLKVYASYNQTVGYCQGMNYIAGTLYASLQDEEKTFKCMVGLVERYGLESLYSPELPRLKQIFYQMDRVLGILLPDANALFRSEMIGSGHFTSSWFITLFTVVLQNKTKILHKLWSLFLLDGWKVLFKASVAILEMLMPDLKAKRFEEIMSIITVVQSSSNTLDLFQDDFIDRLLKVKITNSQLDILQEEYTQLITRVKQQCSITVTT